MNNTEYNQKYYREHRTELLEKHKEYNRKHREELRKKKQIYNQNNLRKHRDWQREWRRNNPGKDASHQRQIRLRLSAYITTRKESGCSLCGEKDAVCLDFHHQNPHEKSFEVSNMAPRKFSRMRIDEEIKKCVVLCCNCHRKIHRKPTVAV